MAKNDNLEFEEYSYAVLVGAAAFITFVLAVLVEGALIAKKENNVKPISKVSSHVQPKPIKKCSVCIERE